MGVLAKLYKFQKQKEERDNSLGQVKDLKDRQRQQEALIRDMKRQRYLQMQRQRAALQKLERDREQDKLKFAEREQ